MKTTSLLLALAAVVAMPALSRAAVGCTLSNPARDLKSLFPEMTTYREDVKELPKLPQGRELYEALKARVGGELDPLYEAFETPYTLYSVFKGDERIGYVHGVNVPGRGGVIQVFTAVDPASAAITRLVFQRLESPGAKAMRAKETLAQFAGLSLADFYKHDYYAAADPGNAADKIAGLTPPEALPEAAKPDWAATVRGLRKNLILLDFFAFDKRHEPFFTRAETARQQKEKEKENTP
ncbi:MAG: hypothetical protein LBW77_04410 [Verrucomicrobiota bacterium]|jgi:hypothetical protein|nr:hypothetical protein [Verrucomicrobiota bacterium]